MRRFPDEDACLLHLFFLKHPDLAGSGEWYRIRTRKCFSDARGRQAFPLSGTIFEKSSTSLWKWFYAIYLFSQSSHGVSAAELQRQLGVTYKCAWRIGTSIRSLMKDKGTLLSGTVECDEAYIGGKHRLAVRSKLDNKTPVFGMVSRKGKIIARPVPDRKTYTLLPIIKASVTRGSRIITDDFAPYKGILGIRYRKYRHKSVNHSKWEYVCAEGRTKIHTNTIEGFWSMLKRQINGTHHFVSPQHLSKYVDEAVWRYNHRGEQMFSSLLDLL